MDVRTGSDRKLKQCFCNNLNIGKGEGQTYYLVLNCSPKQALLYKVFF